MDKQSAMEIITSLPQGGPPIRAAVFDFDGTISTLRHGWEALMEPMMLRALAGDETVTDDLRREVRAYISESTGIQTIYQMQWLAEKVGRRGLQAKDPWEYKAEYNGLILSLVERRLSALVDGKKTADDYLVGGSRAFLAMLRETGVDLYAASGTDHPDVLRESACLGVAGYFTEIAGAPVGMASCSKEAVLRRLLREKNLTGPELVVIGDGKVEIALGREVGAICLGVASDEERRQGVNQTKKRRLIEAGAHVIVGDFTAVGQILDFLKGPAASKLAL